MLDVAQMPRTSRLSLCTVQRVAHTMHNLSAMQPSTSVPTDYRGVWVRTLLQTPPAFGDGVPQADTTTWARWLQTSLWHADLRVPAAAMVARPGVPLASMSPEQLAALSHQTAFAGCTRVDAHPEGERCAWLRRSDYHPPGRHPDAAWMLFDAPDRVIRIDLHIEATEVWQRLPDSVGAYRCLAGLDAAGQDDGRRLMQAGAHLALVRGRQRPWPRGMRPGDSLLDVLLNQPEAALAWLDHEVSFGRLDGSQWRVERSTLPQREGPRGECTLRRDGDAAEVTLDGQTSLWRVLEWTDDAGPCPPSRPPSAPSA